MMRSSHPLILESKSEKALSYGKRGNKTLVRSEADFLEVAFEKGKGVAYDTEDERVEIRLDADGNVLSFHVLGLKSISGSPLNIELIPKETKQPVHPS